MKFIKPEQVAIDLEEIVKPEHYSKNCGIALLGCMGQGKSTFANGALGEKIFKAGNSRKGMTRKVASIMRKRLAVFDVPGLGDT